MLQEVLDNIHIFDSWHYNDARRVGFACLDNHVQYVGTHTCC